MTTVLDRTMPHSLEAERSVIGAIMLHAECLSDLPPLNPAEFYRSAHRRIFAHIRSLEAAGTAVDGLTIMESLKKAGELEGVGGASYLLSLTDGVPRSTNVEHYAAIVKEKARLRATIETANRMITAAYDGDDDAKTVIDRAEQDLFALGQGEASNGFMSMREIMPSVLEQIEAWHAARGHVTGIPTGLAELDRMTGGLQPGNLVIVAARPSLGKSALVMNIAAHAASQGKTVLVFSLEMSKIELAVRAISGSAGIDGHRIQRGAIAPSEFTRISQAITDLSELPLYVDDSPVMTVFDVRGRCRRLKAQHGLDLVILDYTQLMVSAEKGESRALDVAAFTRGFKALAKQLHVPVVALSQLNRKVDDRDDKRPRLSDLRDSGALEQDADVVVFIYRDDYYNEHSAERGIAELIISKTRNGPVGTVKVAWIAEETRFANLDMQHAEQPPLPSWDRK